MASHSSTLAWKILWTEEPGRLQSRGLLRVGHDWATSLSLFTFTHWRRKCQPTPVFLPGESPTGEPGGLPSMGSHRVGYDWSDLAKAVYCHPAYLTYMQSTSWEMLGWRKHKVESRLPGEISINNLRYADDTTLMAESEELKSLLMKVKEESKKVGLKLKIQKAKIMASSPMT